MRKVLAVTATLAVGIALLSCSPRHRVVYLPPPPAYGPAPSAVFAPLPPPTAYSPAPSLRYGKTTYTETSPQSDGHMVLQSSPRRVAVKTKSPDPEAKFKAAQAKAEKIGVENLTKDDIAGLSPAQLKLLRGY